MRRAVCVSSERGCCAAVERALTAAGLVVSHETSLPPPSPDVALIVIDRRARQAAGDALRAAVAPVVVVGDDLDDDSLIALMLESSVSHLVHDPRDRDLDITSEKLASGDLFGLEKYVAPGTRVGERAVFGDSSKRRAMDEVSAFAESVGARRPTLHRIANVVDELLMNALREAPAGGERRAVLRWAADERAVVVSVADELGTLRQRDVIAHVRRARRDGGRPYPSSPRIVPDATPPAGTQVETSRSGGAGLGLYLVLANVAALVVNISPGTRTEIVCVFDISRGMRPSVTGVRSLHVFSAAR
jgi:signal transduction histidine kinase